MTKKVLTKAQKHHQRELQKAKDALGSRASTAKDSTFKFQAHGSRLLEEFRERRTMEKREREEANRPPNVVDLRKDGTKG